MPKTICGADYWTYHRLGCQQTQSKNTACSATYRLENSVQKTQKRTGQLQLPKDIHHASTKTGLMRMMKKLSRFLKKKTAYTRQEQKHHLHKAHQDDTSSVFKKTASSNIYKTVYNKLRDMQDSWLSKKAEVFCRHKGHEVKKFHDALKMGYGPQSSGAIPLLRADGVQFSLIKLLSWKGGQNTSIACSNAHQLSMVMPSTDFLR